MNSKSKYKKFINDSEKIVFDLKHRDTLKFNISKYNDSVLKGKSLYSNIELAKQRVAHIKNKAIGKLDTYLLEFEKNFINNGGKVLWADDGDEAVQYIKEIIKENNTDTVLKSKSMITEEINLNHRLKDFNIEVIETDLGEFIIQQADEKPYHIVTPAMHKSKKDIAELFNEKFGIPKDSSAEFMTHYVREHLREKFTKNIVSISGGNFLVADIGAVSITENEGNVLMGNSLSKTHIAIVGIEKVIPTVEHLTHILPVLAVHGTGQNLTVYNTLFSGPKKKDEIDGVENMYVILLNNGRTNILDDKEVKSSLSCIKCGACLNACPIYTNVGGHTYDSVYNGPIGSIITPHLKNMKDYGYLNSACSLCGKCTEVCPSKIDLHKLLLANRKKVVEQNLDSMKWKIATRFLKIGLLNLRLFDVFGKKIKNTLLKFLIRFYWGQKRELPVVKKSFRKQYMKMMKKEQ